MRITIYADSQTDTITLMNIFAEIQKNGIREKESIVWLHNGGSWMIRKTKAGFSIKHVLTDRDIAEVPAAGMLNFDFSHEGDRKIFKMLCGKKNRRTKL